MLTIHLEIKNSPILLKFDFAYGFTHGVSIHELALEMFMGILNKAIQQKTMLQVKGSNSFGNGSPTSMQKKLMKILKTLVII